MEQKLKKVIKSIFGTENNILLKVQLSFFISGVLFCIFSFIIQKNSAEASKAFSSIAGSLLAIWIILTQDNDSITEKLKEFVRLIAFFYVIIFSLNFCINTAYNAQGFNLAIGSLLSCIGIVSCSFYIISKFVDIFIFFKKILKQIKEKLFNSNQPTTSKAKAAIENITALLISITGLGVALKAIIEPLINIFK